jgi:hypothetical protein
MAGLVGRLAITVHSANNSAGKGFLAGKGPTYLPVIRWIVDDGLES